MTDETMLLKQSNTINEANEKCTNAHIETKIKNNKKIIQKHAEVHAHTCTIMNATALNG